MPDLKKISEIWGNSRGGGVGGLNGSGGCKLFQVLCSAVNKYSRVKLVITVECNEKIP